MAPGACSDAPGLAPVDGGGSHPREFASHPGLRLLIPFIDAVGIDLFVAILGAQSWGCMRPVLRWLYRSLVLPGARVGYSATIHFLGFAGPCLDEKLHVRFPACGLRADYAFGRMPLR